MKKTILLFGILLMISCNNHPEEFRGIADLKLGTEFSVIPDAEKFTKVMADEYNISTYNLSHKIGSVSNLNITTDNGRISEVKFRSNANTNISALEKISEGLVALPFKDNSLSKFKIKRSSLKFYTSADSTVYYAVNFRDDNFENGNQQNEYHYISRDFQLKKA